MRIVVIGAGIAGAVTAVAAQRAGHQVRVIERSPADDAPAGAGISLFGNALRALDTVQGLGERVRAIGGAPPAGTPVGLRTPDGRWLARTLVSGKGRLGEGSQATVVHRADLQRILLGELTTGTVSHGSTVLRIGGGPGLPTVTWVGPTGERTVQADLLVAADGINSIVRRQVVPGDPGVRYAGYTSWRGVTDVPVDLGFSGETWGRGERFGCAPLWDGRVYWFATASVPPGTTFIDDRQEVLRRFGTWHTPIPALLEATGSGAVLHHDINELAAPLRSFVHDRVVLLGDSAHAMTPDLGQGGCQAMEDAVTLVAMLHGVEPADRVALTAALARFDESRRSRAQPLALQARRLGRIGQLRSRPAAVARDGVIRLLPSAVILGASAKVQRWVPPGTRNWHHVAV
jgi:2-polyprenyl-6-methoxyphenol hydroxylase-like FAD-dependent oxidoreductase